MHELCSNLCVIVFSLLLEYHCKEKPTLENLLENSIYIKAGWLGE